MKNTRIISIMALSALIFTGAAKAHSPESDLKFRGGLGYSSLEGNHSAVNATVGLELNQYLGINFDLYKGTDSSIDYTGGGFALELGYNFALPNNFELRPFVEGGMTTGVMNNEVEGMSRDGHLGFSSNIGLRVQHQEVPVYAEFKTDIHTSHTDARFLPENTLLVGFRLPL
ncbi:outer membrane beta-barrel protein [Vibrio maritimus]|uniref:outer membrane beta-barrel protein n=1 Tax=Vibrio maritimus TaxID=990268 RepID=UPI001F23AEA4|nr:outer membrane beta-barrel protein [Vibrio maritimus]